MYVGYIFPTTLNKRTTADNKQKTILYANNFPNAHTLFSACSPSIFGKCLLCALLTAGGQQCCSWMAPSLWAAWNCPWGTWDFKQLCYTPTLLHSCLEMHPMALCFLHTSFPSTANQGSLNITKAGVLMAHTEGSSYLLQPVKPSRIVTTLQRLLPLVSTWMGVTTSWQMKSSTQRAVSPVGLGPVHKPSVVKPLLDPSLKAQNCCVSPCSGEGKGPGKKNQRSFLGPRINQANQAEPWSPCPQRYSVK